MRGEYLETVNLLTQLLKSIRDVNRRISELKWIIKEKLYNKQEKKTITSKIERLYETRMCLIYSVFDVRETANKTLGKSIGNLESLYKELKDL